jgi:hypothetical protein
MLSMMNARMLEESDCPSKTTIHSERRMLSFANTLPKLFAHNDDAWSALRIALHAPGVS